MPPDELPRSPSGRVPKWVIDEAAGRATTPTAWREWEQRPTAQLPSGRYRGSNRGLRVTIAVLSVLITVAVWGRAGWPGVPQDWIAAVEEATGQSDGSALAPDILALADAAYMTDEGRAIFYGTHPRIVDRDQVTELCRRTGPGDRDLETGQYRIAGCYAGDGTGRGMIYLAKPEDPRLYEGLVTTAAHEMLHAAWESLGVREQADLGPILEAEVAALDPADPIHQSIAWSIGDAPTFTASSELFASLGAAVWRDGGMDPRLEDVYSRFISDRAALVAVYGSWSFG